eukprot:GHVS01030508.1.p1 GENE.GHVS01030508.1~~GHVS01030508.1.p1  ORF type:complete len:356 (-),score=34.42 GHVS01030508.1:201-1244(-)
MVVVGITGPLCAGKRTTADLFCQIGYHRHDIQQRHPKGLSVDEQVDAISRAVSESWKENHVVYPLRSEQHIELLSKRPFFLLLRIEAPLYTRLHRFEGKGEMKRADATQEEEGGSWCQKVKEFMEEEDRIQCGSDSWPQGYLYISATQEHSTTLMNSSSIESLRSIIKQVHANCRQWIVWPWDDYFMQLARFMCRRTNCLKRRVGALLVKNNRIISTGYNGTASGAPNCYDGGCERCANPSVYSQAVGLDLCECLHAEVNAVLEAGRERCMGTTLYVTAMPCVGCAKQIAQGGVKKVVFEQEYNTEGKALEILRKSKVDVVRHISTPQRKYISADDKQFDQASVSRG